MTSETLQNDFYGKLSKNNAKKVWLRFIPTITFPKTNEPVTSNDGVITPTINFSFQTLHSEKETSWKSTKYAVAGVQASLQRIHRLQHNA